MGYRGLLQPWGASCSAHRAPHPIMARPGSACHSGKTVSFADFYHQAQFVDKWPSVLDDWNCFTTTKELDSFVEAVKELSLV